LFGVRLEAVKASRASSGETFQVNISGVSSEQLELSN
jgi:hypothetical protein